MVWYNMGKNIYDKQSMCEEIPYKLGKQIKEIGQYNPIFRYIKQIYKT